MFGQKLNRLEQDRLTKRLHKEMISKQLANIVLKAGKGWRNMKSLKRSIDFVLRELKISDEDKVGVIRLFEKLCKG